MTSAVHDRTPRSSSLISTTHTRCSSLISCLLAVVTVTVSSVARNTHTVSNLLTVLQFKKRDTKIETIDYFLKFSVICLI